MISSKKNFKFFDAYDILYEKAQKYMPYNSTSYIVVEKLNYSNQLVIKRKGCKY